MIMLSFFIFIDYFINLKTTTYLYKQKTPFSSLWKDDQIEKNSKKLFEKQKSNPDD